MLFIVFFLLLGSFGPLTGLQGNLENIPVDSGHKAEDTLDGVPTHHRAKSSHMLQYVTAITPAMNTTVGELDGEQFVCYCSSKIISKADWIENIDDDYWKYEKNRMWREIDDLHYHLNQIVEHFNHTKGNHTLHRVYRCDLEDDGTQKGLIRFYYDGEAFISLVLKIRNWTAANDKAESFLNKWEYTTKEANHWTYHLNTTCVQTLRLFLERKANHMLQNITAITPAISSTSAELNGEESDGRPDWQITIAAVLILLLLVGVTAAKFAVSAAIAMVTGLIGIIIWHIQNRVKRKKENEDLPLKAVEY
ncbi:class I histocompatibility antigen, Gogo-C*0101/C*0102 alpha chain-like isoform X2 [Hemibagrus wyckioides]|uniref:class I histocompatibility antigen, Gogo-C*0101/C*0102 alpha chain-like isoform X2 n=1 Tax=Hemibagrus wyckioides TaxID=337641 RepID=UPI00266C97D6|nr:class I histocompatibility antigen, Gogo-C*0101/C*0102 alpha chain-like isoform X2 [Hemibagrus wyckioides]